MYYLCIGLNNFQGKISADICYLHIPTIFEITYFTIRTPSKEDYIFRAVKNHWWIQYQYIFCALNIIHIVMICRVSCYLILQVSEISQIFASVYYHLFWVSIRQAAFPSWYYEDNPAPTWQVYISILKQDLIENKMWGKITIR